MWQAEVKLRQGTWARRFDDEDDARAWIRARIRTEKDTVNPVRGKSLHNLDLREPLPPPVPARIPFDKTKEWGIKP